MRYPGCSVSHKAAAALITPGGQVYITLAMSGDDLVLCCCAPCPKKNKVYVRCLPPSKQPALSHECTATASVKVLQEAQDLVQEIMGLREAM